jgi:hypothetical protein
MADTKLSALTAITALDDADLLLTTDTSATESKKITRANFVTDMAQSTQTLTNKTFNADGTGNSITNIENADIKAAAAISVNKLAALTASEIAISDGSGFLTSAAVATYPSLTELTYVKGVTSAIQTQLNAKGVGDALTSNGLDQFAATTSLELLGTISDETGTGSLVFGTSPAITTPTGIVKGDVGLGNVDNTSDASKNSATVTLTNKTIAAELNTAEIYTEVLTTTDTLAANECYGAVYYVTGAATITLPAVQNGMSLTIVTIGAVAVSVDPNASDLIYLDGTALDDGDKITNLSTAGDIVVLTYYNTTGWNASSNGWTDGGA